MPCKRIGLIAAMPEEIKPLLKEVGDYRKITLDMFPLYNFSLAGKQCSLIESGIGMKRAKTATHSLITSIRPDVLVSFGFGGAVKPGMAVGDLALARKSSFCLGGSVDSSHDIDLYFPHRAQQTLAAIGKELGFTVHESHFLTSDRILNKKELSGKLSPDISNPVLDMETWAVARLAARQEIPLLAIRAVSDTGDEELDFSLDQFTDHDMNIRIHRVLGAIVRKPFIIPQLIRLAANSRIAGRNLAVSLKGILETEQAL
jgi:adenosylhomocysteine nucleosidase